MTGPQIALMVVSILVGVALVQGVVWFFVIRATNARRAALTMELEGAIANGGDVVRRGPTTGRYSGATGGPFSRVRGSAVLALTDRRLFIHTLRGPRIVIERGQITNVRPEAWFGSARRAGWTHVVLTMREGGEVGIGVTNGEVEAWIADVRAALVSA
jgi:hypothetical protein